MAKRYVGKAGLPWGIAALLTLAAGHEARAGKPGESLGRVHTTIGRMAPERLKAAHEDAARIQAARRELPPPQGLHDYKAIFHAHAEDSRHTGGTRPEMLADAKRAGVEVIFLSDHFRPPRDFIEASWRGVREGVLFIPGSETQGFLIHPTQSMMESMDADKESVIETVTRGQGLIFLSHVEERVDHSMAGLTGMEVYNRHADAKDDSALLIWLSQQVTDPKALAELERSLELYPDEILAAQLDYPALYLEKWDRESARRRIVGVAANDCHHNQVFVVKMVDEKSVRLGTIVDDDEDMRLVTLERAPGIAEMTRGRKSGDVLARLDFDPYYRSFLNVSTHVFASELTEEAVREAVAEGRAYVSHDWMCDPEGFLFWAEANESSERSEDSERSAIMGEEVLFERGLRLRARFPVECKIRLIGSGEPVAEAEGDRFDFEAPGPGVYRIEGWLTIDGEERPWIYSNPIYVR